MTGNDDDMRAFTRALFGPQATPPFLPQFQRKPDDTPPMSPEQFGRELLRPTRRRPTEDPFSDHGRLNINISPNVDNLNES